MATTVERGEVREGEGGRRRETLVRWRLEINRQLFKDKWPTVCNLERREERDLMPPPVSPLTSRRAELQH